MMPWLKRILIVGVVLPLLLLPVPARADIDSFFDVFSEVPVPEPPLPTTPIITIVGSYFGPLTTHEQISMSLTHLDHGVWEETMPGEVRGHDSGGGPGLFGIDSFFDVFMYLPVGAQVPHANFRVEEVHRIPASGQPSMLVVRHPEILQDDPARFFDVTMTSSFFDIYFSVDCGCGILDYHLHGSTPNVGFSFLSAQVVRMSSETPHCMFEIVVDASVADTFDPMLPAWALMTSATFTEFPTPVAPATWSGIKTLLGS